MDFDSLLAAYKKDGGRSRPPPSSSSSSAPYPKRGRPSVPVKVERRRRRDPQAGPLRVLIIVCAGPASLHDTWFEAIGKEDGEDNGGLEITTCVMWYGKDEPEERFVSMADKVVRKQGPKWVLVRTALNEHYPDWRTRFEYLWMPDDDIRFVLGSVGLMIQTMNAFDIALAQPSLLDKNITCAAYRSVVVRSEHPHAVFHRTNFVEIMCPVFTTAALNHVYKTLDDDRCQCGWGLDSVWPVLLATQGIAVLDIVQIEHTRPPNAFGALSSSSYESIDPRKEELDLLTRYRVAPFTKRVLEIVEEER